MDTENEPSQKNEFSAPKAPSALHLKPLTEKQRKLHEHALASSVNFRRGEAALIQALIEIDQNRIFIKLGYPSLFRYTVEALQLSEATSYTLISVARKAHEVKALKTMIEQGKISASKARKIVSVLTPKNHAFWLEKTLTLTTRQLEKEVAKENPKSATPEHAKYVSEKRLSLHLGIEEHSLLQFRKAQDQVSRSLGKSASLETTLKVVLQFYLKHHDPVEKAKRVIAKKGTHSISKKRERRSGSLTTSKNRINPSQKTRFTGTVRPDQNLIARVSQNANLDSKLRQSAHTHFPVRIRTPIPVAIEHQVRLRDQDRCQFKLPHGSTCNEQRWIELHHIKPISEGGDHRVENIITLCRNHHQALHIH